MMKLSDFNFGLLRTGIKTWGLVGLLLVVAIPALLLIHRYAFLRGVTGADLIYANIRVNGVDVGGLSIMEANTKLTERYQTLLDKKVIRFVLNGETVYEAPFKAFDARYDFTALAEEAYRYGRTGSSSARYKQLKSLSRQAYEINKQPNYQFNESLIPMQLKKVNSKVSIAPVNASFARVGREFEIRSESAGQEMDMESAVSQTREWLKSDREGVVELTLKKLQPQYTANDLEFPLSRIGSFETTCIGSDAEARIINIGIAMSRINNYTLYPGEVFSANALLGPSTPEKGYARATVIINGRPVEDYGGGICQLVSTLYNAVLYAELPVVERMNHSLKVSYVDYGYDATVAGDYFDLKFKNDTGHPLLIVCSRENGMLTVELYGFEVHNSTRTLEFRNELIETVPPAPEKVLSDGNLAAGETVVSTAAREGYRYELYKYIYENGLATGKEKVNTSVYKAVQGVVSIGA